MEDLKSMLLAWDASELMSSLVGILMLSSPSFVGSKEAMKAVGLSKPAFFTL